MQRARSDERAAAIRQEAANLAFARGWDIVPDEGLLTEVAGLVEWPVPLMGVIEEARAEENPPEPEDRWPDTRGDEAPSDE